MSVSVTLPDSWVLAPIASIAEINPRSFCTLPTAAQLPVHFVPMSAVTENFGGIDVSLSRPLAEVQKGYTSFLADDVLFAKITPCMENGKLAVVPPLPHHIAFGSTEFHVLRATSAVHPAWLAYFLSQTMFRKSARQNMTGSAGQMRVATTWLSSAGIPVAPVAEQARILEKFQELLPDLDAGVAELIAAQKKLSLYRQSLLKAAVDGSLTASWREVQRQEPGKPKENGAQLLERILTERRAYWEAMQLAKFAEQGKTPPTGWHAKYPEPLAPDVVGLPILPHDWTWATIDQLSPDDLANGRSVPTAETGAKVLRLTALRNGEVDLKEFKHGAWSDEAAKPFAVVNGDLLIARGNGSLKLVGRAGLVSGVTEPVAYPDTMIRLRLVESVVRPAWIRHLWEAAQTRSHMERRARTSAGIYKISQPDIVSAVVPVPPLAEQDELLNAITVGSEEIVLMERAIDVALKQSAAQRQNILKAAFSGQLVPQDPNDEPAAVLLERIRAERAAAGTGSGKRGRKTRALS